MPVRRPKSPLESRNACSLQFPFDTRVTWFKRTRSVLLRSALALTLVLAQQVGALHELSHGFSALNHKSDSPEPGDHLCEKCLAFSSLGHILSAAVVPLAPSDLSFPDPEHFFPIFTATPLSLAYRSRAPPDRS